VLDADPAADIRNIRALHLVIANGRVVHVCRLPHQAICGSASAPAAK
jgi:hypothetical protein